MPRKTDHEILLEIHTVLLGTNGQGGLCRQVERNGKAIFKIWMVIIALAVSTGGGAYGLVKILLG